jgi:hypothetical protein
MAEELEWVLLRNAAVAAALVGEDAAGPLREKLLAEAALSGRLTEQMEAEAAREASAEALERRSAGALALAAALGVQLEQTPETGAAALLEDLAQEGLWTAPEDLTRTAAAATRQQQTQTESRDRQWAETLRQVLGDQNLSWEAGAEDAGDSSTNAARKTGRRRGRTAGQAGETLDSWTGDLLAEQAVQRQSPVAREGRPSAGRTVTSGTSWREWAAGGTHTDLNFQSGQSGGGTTSMAEISRFFERDARRY